MALKRDTLSRCHWASDGCHCTKWTTVKLAVSPPLGQPLLWRHHRRRWYSLGDGTPRTPTSITDDATGRNPTIQPLRFDWDPRRREAPLLSQGWIFRGGPITYTYRGFYILPWWFIRFKSLIVDQGDLKIEILVRGLCWEYLFEFFEKNWIDRVISNNYQLARF